VAKTGAEILVETLLRYGVEVVFGLPGDGINGIMEALRKSEDRIRFVQVRHEEAAALMACGYAKYTGRLGVCLATSGPGGLHLLNGLYDAKMDGQPVLAITGHHYHDLIDTFAQQDVDLDRGVHGRRRLQHARDGARARRERHRARLPRGAGAPRRRAHQLPVDLQSMDARPAQRAQRRARRHAGLRPPSGDPVEADLRRAADVLNAGRRIAILAGRGAWARAPSWRRSPTSSRRPSSRRSSGAPCLPDDSPFTTGTIGLLGTKPSQDAIEGCDTLFMIGTSFPYMEFLPKPGQARAVQIRPRRPSGSACAIPSRVALLGDSRRTLRALIPFLGLTPRTERSFLHQASRGCRTGTPPCRSRPLAATCR
jgi:pyruvate dehydrogenase (quinone)/pyruvate oxidase